jgi:ribosomal protein S18 acetylase RimI-like enzyme
MPLPALKIATAQGELQIKRATTADFDVIYAMMVEAATWLRSRDISQWSFFFTEPSKDFVRNRIIGAETYLVFDPPERPVATFTLYWKDEEIWGGRGLDGTAGYIHGLAVCRRAAGRGLGHILLTTASNLIAQNSRRWARLDCMAQNEALCNYYRRAGFTDLGVADSNITGKPLRLFQRPIASR